MNKIEAANDKLKTAERISINLFGALTLEHITHGRRTRHTALGDYELGRTVWEDFGTFVNFRKSVTLGDN